MTDPFTRIRRLQASMRHHGLDAIVCRLPENVVFLSEHWPIHGVSIAVLEQEGRAHLLIPEIETAYANPDWADVEVFGWSLVKDRDLYEEVRERLSRIRDERGLSSACIGVEQSFEVVGSSYRAAEPIVPAAPWNAALTEVFPSATLVDCRPAVIDARKVKSTYELAKLRNANRIAEIGMQRFLAELEPGMTEIELGAMIEHAIRAEGPGHDGARLVRASAEVSAGPHNSARAVLLVPSTAYRIREGDLVMVELGVVVDGYWADLTYMAIAGREPSAEQRGLHNTVLRAQQEAADQMRPGRPWSAPDEAARRVFKDAGLLDHFPHITGHGIGFRYHESEPLLAPGADQPLEEGMVSSVEPGVYRFGSGGIRIEDIVAVGAQGPEFLSTPREPW
ncbi:MAG: Xaa-Pro peptidase family protein [Truepera sp.]|nr:Xaa-Pro peptidase family protein [Truepera sp.]